MATCTKLNCYGFSKRFLPHQLIQCSSMSTIINTGKSKIQSISSSNYKITSNSINYIKTHKKFFVKPGHEEFPGGSYHLPNPSQVMKPPSIRVGGGGISMGPEFEQDLKGLPWEPADVHPERPPPGFMNIDGFFNKDIHVDGKKYNHSILIMPQFVVKWNVDCLEDITPKHFAAPTIHYPAIRHIFVGCGYTMPCPTPPEWMDYLAKYKVTVEICALGTAARLFNMQNTLFQNFACALVYEEHVIERFHNLVKKSDLDMEDPHDAYSGRPRESLYFGGKKWE